MAYQGKQRRRKKETKPYPYTLISKHDSLEDEMASFLSLPSKTISLSIKSSISTGTMAPSLVFLSNPEKNIIIDLIHLRSEHKLLTSLFSDSSICKVMTDPVGQLAIYDNYGKGHFENVVDIRIADGIIRNTLYRRHVYQLTKDYLSDTSLNTYVEDASWNIRPVREIERSVFESLHEQHFYLPLYQILMKKLEEKQLLPYFNYYNTFREKYVYASRQRESPPSIQERDKVYDESYKRIYRQIDSFRKKLAKQLKLNHEYLIPTKLIGHLAKPVSDDKRTELLDGLDHFGDNFDYVHSSLLKIIYGKK